MTRQHPDIPRPWAKGEDCCRGAGSNLPCSQTMPLSQACCRGRLRICGLSGDRKTCARMASLGIFPGSELEVLCPGKQGNQCMVRIHGSTLSLDPSAAASILVTVA